MNEIIRGKREHVYSFTVKEEMTDGYGHVNNAYYLKLYEDARWAILEEKGLGEAEVRSKKTGPVILEVTVRFRKELIPGQLIKIITHSRMKGNKIIYLDQEMVDENGKICSNATFTSALFDLVERRMVNVDEKWADAFGF